MEQKLPYKTLTSENCIRLLNIKTRDPDNIECYHHEIDLSDWGSCSVFTALSYRWGSEQDSRHITLNGQRVVVRKNLYDFLVHAISESWDKNLWIDALCINQSNEREKSKQVAIMSEIYSHASQVLIWLGVLGEEESDSLIDLSKRCKYINTTFKDVPARDILAGICGTSESEKFKSQWAYLSMGGSFKSWDACIRRGLVRVLQNPYWERKWIIQEILLSGPNACIVTFDWMQPTIPITDVARGVKLVLDSICCDVKWFKQQLEHSPQDPHHVKDLRSLGRLLGYMPQTGIFDLENPVRAFWDDVADAKMTYKPQRLMDLVDRFRDHACTDPRDSIYAMISLSTLPQGRLVVNYSCTIEELYERVWSIVRHDPGGHRKECLKRVMGLPHGYPDRRKKYIDT